MPPLDSHLDLGCGSQPRNPYRRRHLYGVDLRDGHRVDPPFAYRRANLAIESIPFASDAFDSVSAFDFIEHIPRQLVIDGKLVLPFIALMNEVWRVLRPGGLFYAVTPAFPSPEVFQDPTHVNIITNQTHKYFCGPDAGGQIYGFTGCFRARQVKWVAVKNTFTADTSWRKTLRTWHRRVTGSKGGLPHLLWELEAVK